MLSGYASKPNIWETEARDLNEFKANLGYIRTAYLKEQQQ